MVVAVWQDWQAAKDTATDEANELAAVFWIAHALPEPQARHVQELARSYTRVVVEEEWPLMRQGKASPKAWDLLDELRGSIVAFHPTTDTQVVLYDHDLQRVHDLGDARREPLLKAESGLPAILWVVLLLGGAIVVGFTYLFGLRSTTVHMLRQLSSKHAATLRPTTFVSRAAVSGSCGLYARLLFITRISAADYKTTTVTGYYSIY